MDNERQRISKLARSRKRNTMASVAAMAFMVAGSAFFAIGNDWKGSGEMKREAPLCETIRGDGRCPSREEAYPCKVRPDGTEKRDKDGKCLEPNPCYSKEDCHKGDGVCDNNAKDIRDPDGKPVKLLTHWKKRTEDGKWVEDESRPVKLPLEGKDDCDCKMEVAREAGNRCEEYKEDNPIKRALITMECGECSFWMAPEELARRHVSTKEFPDDHGGDRRVVNYKETCDENLAICDPDKPKGKCYCQNNDGCVNPPKVPTCQNGLFESWLEACDPTHAVGKNACGPNKECTKKCTCRDAKKEKKEPICGNGEIEPPKEECDHKSTKARGGCEEGYECTESCTCKKTEPEPKPKPKSLEKCRNAIDIGAASKMADQAFKSLNDINGLIARVGPKGSASVFVSFPTVVGTNGRPVSVSTAVQCTPRSQCDSGSASGPAIPVGKLSGSLGKQPEKCFTTLPAKKIN